MQVDYIVSCHNAENGSLYVIAGSNEGSLALCQLLADSDLSTAKTGRIAMHLCGGHMDVVRCFHQFASTVLASLNFAHTV